MEQSHSFQHLPLVDLPYRKPTTLKQLHVSRDNYCGTSPAACIGLTAAKKVLYNWPYA